MPLLAPLEPSMSMELCTNVRIDVGVKWRGVSGVDGRKGVVAGLDHESARTRNPGGAPPAPSSSGRVSGGGVADIYR